MHALRAHMDQLEHALPGQLNSSSKLVAQKREENVSVVRAVQPTWYVVSCRACLRYVRMCRLVLKGVLNDAPPFSNLCCRRKCSATADDSAADTAASATASAASSDIGGSAESCRSVAHLPAQGKEGQSGGELVVLGRVARHATHCSACPKQRQ